jgi:hypothetical protein
MLLAGRENLDCLYFMYVMQMDCMRGEGKLCVSDRLPARMRAQVCFCGCHYVAYVKQQPGDVWAVCNDAVVSHVGAWPAVRKHCAGRPFQPSLLFYEAV